MESYKTQEGRISIFKNDKKVEEKHPDYTGKTMVGGKLYKVSLWKTTAQSGLVYMSGQIQQWQENESKVESNVDDTKVEDDMPF